MTDYGLPTAKKVRDCGWWLPAVTTAAGPRALPHGDRQDTPGKAKAEARRILSTLSKDKIDEPGV